VRGAPAPYHSSQSPTACTSSCCLCEQSLSTLANMSCPHHQHHHHQQQQQQQQQYNLSPCLPPMSCPPPFHPPGAPQGMGVASQGNLLDWADKALGQGISSVTRGVKNLLSGARQAPVAAALEALMDGKQVGSRGGVCLRGCDRQMKNRWGVIGGA